MAEEEETSSAPSTDDAVESTEPQESGVVTESAAEPPEPVTAPAPEAPTASTPAAEAKKRGRPKGSKNKPKVVAIPVVTAQPVEPPPSLAVEPATPKPKRTRIVTKVQDPPPMATIRQDLSDLLSIHLVEVERKKRQDRQELYAQLVRGAMG